MWSPPSGNPWAPPATSLQVPQLTLSPTQLLTRPQSPLHTCPAFRISVYGSDLLLTPPRHSPATSPHPPSAAVSAARASAPPHVAPSLALRASIRSRLSASLFWANGRVIRRLCGSCPHILAPCMEGQDHILLILVSSPPSRVPGVLWVPRACWLKQQMSKTLPTNAVLYHAFVFLYVLFPQLRSLFLLQWVLFSKCREPAPVPGRGSSGRNCLPRLPLPPPAGRLQEACRSSELKLCH